MTKDQFISGQSFKVQTGVNYKGSATFKFDGDCILQQSRSSIDESVLFTKYHLNVGKISSVGFEGFVYVMSKLVKVKYRFEELEVFEEGV
jgi:hypothetical protein